MKVKEWEIALQQIIALKLETEYFKAKQYIEAGNFRAVQLRKREPKNLNVWYFRINSKFRAFAIKETDTLVVFKVANEH